MVGFRQSLEDAIRSNICQVLQPLATAQYVFSDALGNVTGIDGLPQPSAWAANFICPNDPPPQPVPPTYNGGQCACINYAVSTTINYDEFNNGVPTGSGTQTIGGGGGYFGKLGGVRNQPIPNGLELQIETGIDCPGETVSFRTIGFFQLVLPGTAIFRRITSQTYDIVRVDGQPDNCGNPPVQPPPPPPPNANVVNTNFTYNDNSGNNFTIPLAIVVGVAYVNARAEINIPLNLTLNATANFTANFNLSTGGITINPPAGGGQRRYPTDDCSGNGNRGYQPSPTLPPSPVDPSNPNEPPDDESVIVGVVITSSEIESRKPTIILQTDNPNIYAPSLGYVSFFISVGGGEGGGWTTDIPVKNIRQFIACPWDGGATDVKATPIPGVTFEVTPIRRSIKEPQPIT